MNPNSNFHMYQGIDDMISLSHGVETYSNTLMYNVSILRDKMHQLESFVGAIVSSEQIVRHEPNSTTISNAESAAQEIITAASSTLHALQQINIDSICRANDHNIVNNLFTIDSHYNGNPSINPNCNNGENEASSSRTSIKDQTQTNITPIRVPTTLETNSGRNNELTLNIVELDAEALLARYTHYCQVCGKGFKRDANLRMHMRAHGDEYKTKSALTNPTKSTSVVKEPGSSPKYSCPQEGCRWNKKHARFTPLKSMVCVKNHYKRSHCPKMYVCKRCNQKNFSVLSDLRTHEKHCGELRWRCSCGTYFSRKDKLMGHVALFVGHEPV